jgi:hypothetical protein
MVLPEDHDPCRRAPGEQALEVDYIMPSGIDYSVRENNVLGHGW